jgi:ribosomal protein L10
MLFQEFKVNLKPVRDRIMLERVRDILSHYNVLFYQVNNLKSKTCSLLRSQLQNHDVKLSFTSPNIIKDYIMNTTDLNKRNGKINGSKSNSEALSFLQPLCEVLFGPIIVAYTNKHPSCLSEPIGILGKESPNLFFFAAKLEDQLFTAKGFSDTAKSLPKKHDLYASIPSILQPVYHNMTMTLDSVGQKLHLLLDANHKKQ